MLENYLPIMIFLTVAFVMGGVVIGLGFLLGTRKPDDEKLSPYECGFEAFENSRMKFDVRYYLVAILFIIFDLEIAFLFPWAVVLDQIGMVGFIAMMVFLAILVIGFLVWALIYLRPHRWHTYTDQVAFEQVARLFHDWHRSDEALFRALVMRYQGGIDISE